MKKRPPKETCVEGGNEVCGKIWGSSKERGKTSGLRERSGEKEESFIGPKKGETIELISKEKGSTRKRQGVLNWGAIGRWLCLGDT